MPIYLVIRNESAMLTAGRTASTKVTGIKRSGNRIIVETSEPLTAQEESAVLAAIESAPMKIEREAPELDR